MTMDMGQVCTTGDYKLRSDGLLDVQYRTLIPMDFFQYGESPVMKMDCSQSFQCDFDIEGWEKDDNKDYDFEFGILGTDYDNWYVLYGCGQWWDGTGMMNTLAIMGK